MATSARSQTQVYELRVYEIGFFRSADVLHTYFENALIPALNRQGAKNVGVFEEMGESLPKKVYLLIPHKDIVTFQDSERKLFDDETYLKDADPYLTADQATIPFNRISTSLVHSTKEFPELTVPNSAGIYELRIYESHNEGALKNKLRMFEDEFSIFADAGLNMVFYGKNIYGDHMPCLTYMLANTDLNDNKEGWSKFVNHPRLEEIDVHGGIQR
ncbi:NIPSNAP family containing protein [Maribacter litopenaei]|uniref:NIPSNAP family containing protein n=1 Tax=Maribacter litopenaei TaxID=2976127 RepID=A0ABY5YBB0_9FLAO|nr:NIPSNAP family containing protein [Maribacter litopenaei]UWX56337.1 NIPSNAP family containing protein [Maribacter litopenaei]